MTLILQGLLTLLAFLLPFEARRPVLSFAPYTVITDLELVALLAVGVWGVTAVRERRLPPPSGVPAWALALCGVALLSALTAPAFRPASVKFALRMAAGVCLMTAVADRGMSLKALVAGAAVSSALGVWTCLRPDQTAWLVPLFREREFLVGDTIRLSGTFEYPNIAAAFLAMAFVLSTSCLPVKRSRTEGQGSRVKEPLFPFIWVAAQGLILLGLILTLSRAGLAVGLLGLCLVVALHGIRVRRTEGRASILPLVVKPFLPTLALTFLLLTGTALFYPPFLLRFQTGGDRDWYSARYETLDAAPMSAGGLSTATVRVTNTGRIPWRPEGGHPFRLSYHWMEAGTEKAFPAPQARTELPGEVAPGASVTLQARVVAPARPGDYVLAWDMVHEHAAWFSQKGCPTGKVACRVGEASPERPAFAGREETPPDPTALEAESVSRGTLWRAAWGMFQRHPILGVGPDNFRRLWGREFGMGRWDERVHANNLLVEVFVTTGLLGGLAFLGLVVSLVRTQIRCLRGYRGDEEKFSVAPALAGATGVFLVHGMVDCFIAFTPVYLLFWMGVGLTVKMGRDS